MKKKFITVLPDEPYKPVAKNNNAVECEYDGPRYLILRISASDGHIFCIDRESNDLETIQSFLIDQHKLDPEGMYQIILDAEENVWEAAHLTGYYSHAPFPDYHEVLPDGLGEYTYHYDDNRGAAEQPFYVNDMFYEKETKTFRRPRYRTHAVAKKDFWAGIQAQLDQYTAVLEGSQQGYTEEKLRSHVEFLSTCEEKYGKIDHWKIPFPTLSL